MGETEEDAIRREVLEETGVLHGVDRQACIHEDLISERGSLLKDKDSYERSFQFLI